MARGFEDVSTVEEEVIKEVKRDTTVNMKRINRINSIHDKIAIQD